MPRGWRGVAVADLRVRRRPLPAASVVTDPFPRLLPAAAAVDVAAARRPHVEAVDVLDQVVTLRLRHEVGRAVPWAGMPAADGFPRGRRLPRRIAAGDPAATGPACQHFGPGAGSRTARSVVRGDGGVLLLAWPDIRFAVEYDGEHHLQRLPEDRARLNELQELGWRVLSVTEAEMRDMTSLIVAITRAHDACAAHRMPCEG